MESVGYTFLSLFSTTCILTLAEIASSNVGYFDDLKAGCHDNSMHVLTGTSGSY